MDSGLIAQCSPMEKQSLCSLLPVQLQHFISLGLHTVCTIMYYAVGLCIDMVLFEAFCSAQLSHDCLRFLFHDDSAVHQMRSMCVIPCTRPNCILSPKL